MFCYKCGIELMEGAIFCHICGTKVTNVKDVRQNGSTNVNLHNSVMNPVIVKGLGRNVEFPQDINEYIKIRNMYMTLAVEDAMKFYDNINRNYKTLNEFIKQVPRDIDKLYYSFINRITSDLNNRGCFQISEYEIVCKMKEKIGVWAEAFEAFVEAYDNITGEYTERIIYQTMERNNRGKIIGGGFGLAGATKGIITAGAINTTVGFFNSIFDSMTDSQNRSNMQKKKEQVLKNEDMRQNMATAIYFDIFMMHYVHITIINEKMNKQFPMYTIEMYNQAETLYHNIDTEKVSKQKIKDAIVNLIKLYPFESKYYELAYLVLDEPIESYKNLMEMFSISKFDTHDEDIINSCKILANNRIMQNKGGYFTTSNAKNIAMIEKTISKMDSYLKCAYPENNVNSKKIENMKANFNVYDNEEPLVVYDNTVFGGGTKGFIITNQAVYAKHSGNGFRCPLEEIESIVVEFKPNSCWEATFNGYPIMIYSSDLVKDGYMGIILEFIIHSACVLKLTRFRKTNILVEFMKSFGIDMNSKMNETTSESEIDLEDLIAEIEKQIVRPFVIKAEEKNYISSFPNINESMNDAMMITFKMYKIDFESEYPVFYYDDGIINKGKSGFLLTNLKLYFHNKEGQWMIDIEEIKTIEYTTKKFLPGLLLNNTSIIPCKLMGHETTKQFPKTFYEIKDVLLKYNR